MSFDQRKIACQYCSAQNEAEDHRCHRCGRRLIARSEQPISTSALAPALEPDTRPAAESKPAFRPQLVPPKPVQAPAEHREPAYQASLFGPQEVRAAAPAPPPKKQSTPRPKVDRAAQRSLDFNTGSRALQTSVEATIYCNAPVAMTPLRVMAAIFDTCLSLLGVMVLFATIHFAERDIVLTSQPVWFYAVCALTSMALYRILFCLGNNDTPGVLWTGLCILNFDGRKPTRRQRFYRLAGACVSLVAAGIGLLWAIFDEEKLTWHDHMSNTFPTVAGTLRD